MTVTDLFPATDTETPPPPRIGDRLTAAAQLNALPEGSVIVSTGGREVWSVVRPDSRSRRFRHVDRPEQNRPAYRVLNNAATYVVVWLPGEPFPVPPTEVTWQYAIRWPDGELEIPRDEPDGGEAYARRVVKMYDGTVLEVRTVGYGAFRPVT